MVAARDTRHTHTHRYTFAVLQTYRVHARRYILPGHTRSTVDNTYNEAIKMYMVHLPSCRRGGSYRRYTRTRARPLYLFIPTTDAKVINGRYRRIITEYTYRRIRKRCYNNTYKSRPSRSLSCTSSAYIIASRLHILYFMFYNIVRAVRVTHVLFLLLLFFF